MQSHPVRRRCGPRHRPAPVPRALMFCRWRSPRQAWRDTLCPRSKEVPIANVAGDEELPSLVWSLCRAICRSCLGPRRAEPVVWFVPLLPFCMLDHYKRSSPKTESHRSEKKVMAGSWPLARARHQIFDPPMLLFSALAGKHFLRVNRRFLAPAGNWWQKFDTFGPIFGLRTKAENPPVESFS